MQKQAVLVCSVCALAAILTIAITMTLLKRGKTPAAPGEQPSSEVLVPGGECEAAHAAGLEVNPWTVNAEDDLRRVIAAGADRIITNYPDRGRAVADED